MFDLTGAGKARFLARSGLGRGAARSRLRPGLPLAAGSPWLSHPAGLETSG
jgi:hypothetical protein